MSAGEVFKVIDQYITDSGNNTFPKGNARTELTQQDRTNPVSPIWQGESMVRDIRRQVLPRVWTLQPERTAK